MRTGVGMQRQVLRSCGERSLSLCTVINLTSSATSASECPVSPSVFQEGYPVPGNMCQQYYTYSCSVAKSCPTLCNPMNRSMPGLPVHHQLLESTQTLVHPVSDAIQLSHPLSFPSPPPFNLSQHQGLFK